MSDFLAAAASAAAAAAAAAGGEPAPDDAFPHTDLFETISEAHYLPELGGPHDEELLESLVEKGCEDNQILALDKLAHLVQAADYAHAPSPTANISAAQGLLHLHRTPAPAAEIRQYPDEFTLEALAPPPPTIPHEEYTERGLAYQPPAPAPAPPEPAPVPDQSDVRAPPPPEVEPPKQASAEPCLEIPIDQIKTDVELEETTVGDNSSEDMENDTVELVATDLSIKCAEKAVQRHSVTIEPVLTETKPEEQPRDLTLCRRSPPPRAAEPPRAPSRESDAMQSPQPSGIPAVPSSPELFTAPQTKSKQTLFLETLLSSPSPKMYTSEVTITKQLCEPMNLGKHRKSASPTVTSCSDEIRKLNKDFGEPQEKRSRRESTEELAKISKVLARTETELIDKSKRLLEKSNKLMDENSPMKQLQILKNSPDFNIPDPLLVPKDKLNDILAAPGREIPALLIQNPELRLPDAFSYPTLYQNPNILVVSFAQLEEIIATRQIVKLPEPKPKSSSKSSEHQSSKSSETSQKPTPSIEGMGDLDAANTAAFNQMFWLPYISQLEAAMGCTPNMDFLKAMNASGYNAGSYSELAQMFNPQSRFSQGNFPMMPPMDYENRLQFAMWQEAMSQANAAAQRSKASESSKSTDVQNPYVHSTKNTSKTHSSARTSPIAHNYNTACQRGSMAHNPFLQGMYPSMNPNVRPNVPLPGLQIPYFNPMMGSQRSPRTTQQKSPTSPFYQNNNYLQSLKQQESQPQPRSSSTGSQESPRPRISVKSLQNLLEPSAAPGAPRRHSTPSSQGGSSRRREDTEVGSTTPLGEMPQLPPHDPIHQLWHPLFGNQKAPGYTSPWSWTTVTATGD